MSSDGGASPGSLLAVLGGTVGVCVLITWAADHWVQWLILPVVLWVQVKSAASSNR